MIDMIFLKELSSVMLWITILTFTVSVDRALRDFVYEYEESKNIEVKK